MKLEFDIDIRTYEIDSYGHLNNAVYLNYFEYTRLKYLEAAGFDYKAFTDEGLMLYVTKINIRYLKSVFLGDKIRISVEPTKKGVASGIFHQEVINQDNDICTEADTTWGCVSKATGKPTKLPKKYYVF